MPQETNRLHKRTAIAAAIVLCLDAMIDLYNYFQYYQHPMFSNLWYSCTILIPIALSLILAIFLFRRKKDIATGCVFLLKLIYSILIAPLFYIMWMVTDHVIVQSDTPGWLQILLTLMGCAYLLMMALDCFLSSKQVMRKVRILFLILPIMSTACNIVISIAGYMKATLILDVRTIFALMAGYIISYAPTILTGLSFFLPYDRKPAPENPVQQ